MEANIELKQKPIISHALQEMGKKVTLRIKDLNLENQIANEDTIKSLKETRANLNKEATEFEAQRKFVKEAILSPYNEFEAVYKTEIIEKYKAADELLKNKINEFELGLKSERMNNLESYFKEICSVEKIDWLSFDRLGISITLSTSEKKYKEQINSIISSISEDLSLISTEEHAAEILVEYKKTLKASQSIQEIRRRKEEERREKERIQLERTNKRTSQLQSLSFIFHDLTRTYNWIEDESIMISLDEVETLSNDEWLKVHVELEAKTKKQEQPKHQVAEPLQAPKTTPYPAPVENKEEKKFSATFTVIGTYNELKLLQGFLKSNNYNYKNIE